MALITVADVAKATGKTYTSGTAIYNQIQFFCDVIEAYVTSIVGYVFTPATFTLRMQADYDGIITLPKRPVTAVSAIATPSGLNVTGWSWDGLDEVDGLQAHQVIDITFTAGYTTTPSDLKMLATAVAARQATNPDGIRQKTVGAISETFAAGDGSAGSVFFTPMENLILKNYSTSMDTWRLGPRVSQAVQQMLPTL
ncbi:MAG TPA: hypothetical protein VLS45_07555 [Methylomicrobium sp.]|nr:hypothetical protein [Methylomicrobium sp.]